MSSFEKPAFLQLLSKHLASYLEMQPQDLVKLCYQRAFGAAHFCGDMQQAVNAAVQETAECTGNSEPLLQPLDAKGDFYRFSLSAAKQLGLDILPFARAFALDAASCTADEAWFAEALDTLVPLAKQRLFCFSAQQMSDYLEKYRAAGCPAVSHSEHYRALYHPHYRVFCGRVARLLPLLIAISQKKAALPKGRRLSIALDGLAASGKTTAGEYLAQIFDTDVVHMDDFFLPPALRTAERLAEAGGNVHYERFAQQVAPHLQQAEPFDYQVFSCKEMDFASCHSIGAHDLLFVEGAYALHPSCGGNYGLSAFFSISPELQQQRILQRNGAAMWERFRDSWIPMEKKYAEHFSIEQQADFIIC